MTTIRKLIVVWMMPLVGGLLFPSGGLAAMSGTTTMTSATTAEHRTEVETVCRAETRFQSMTSDQAWSLLGLSRVFNAPKNVLDDVIHVTPDGVALPKGPKYKIPDHYVENPHRPGNYGEIVDGKFKERLRIDPATPAGKKGPEHSHYHLNGGKEHYSPRLSDQDPGF